MKYITTTMMAADLYTKAFTEPSKWNHLCLQNNIFPSTPKNGKWDELPAFEKLHDISYQKLIEGQPEGRLLVTPTDALPPGLEGYPVGNPSRPGGRASVGVTKSRPSGCPSMSF